MHIFFYLFTNIENDVLESTEKKHLSISSILETTI